MFSVSVLVSYRLEGGRETGREITPAERRLLYTGAALLGEHAKREPLFRGSQGAKQES